MPKKSIWAMDFGAWSMKVARGRSDRDGAIEVDLYDEIRYHDLDVEGEAEGLLHGAREAVDEFSRRHSIEAPDDLCVAVSGGGVFSRFINLPPVPDSVDDIIQYEAMQQIPFDMGQVVWDYQTVKEEHEPWEEVKVGLFALKSDAIEELTAILDPWRRNLRIIQQAPLATFNFMSLEGYDAEPTVVIDIGGKTTALVVIDPPGFWMRSLLIGGDAITDRIESHFGVSRREAERIKERASESGKTAQLLRVIGKPIGDILSEVQRSLGYYKSTVPDVKFDKVIGVGNAFRLKGLDRVLAEGLQTEVKVLGGVRNLTLRSRAKNKIGEGLCGCCALFGLIAQCAGRGRVRVNMVPEKIAFENEMRGKKPFLAAAVAGVVAIVAMLILGEAVYARRMAGVDKDAGKEKVERLNELRRAYSAQQRNVDQVQGRLEGFVGREVRRGALVHVLSELTQAVLREEVPRPDSLLPRAAYMRDISFRREGGWGNVAGAGSPLLVEASFEATVPYEEYEEFVEEQLEALRQSTYAKTGRPVFSRVELDGEVRFSLRRVTEDAERGEFISEDPTERAWWEAEDDFDVFGFAEFAIEAEVIELTYE